MIKWERLKTECPSKWIAATFRAKVSGGWLVTAVHLFGSGLTFLPDPNHTWDGKSLP